MSGNHEHGTGRCRELADRLSEYLDGELPAELAAEIETHFSDCRTCDRFLDSLRRTRELAHLLPRVELPPDQRLRLVDGVRKRLDG